MPLYEYHCHSCQRRVTILVRDSSLPPSCPHCRGQQMTRLFSSFAIRRSYTDDYEDILSDSRLVRGLESNDPRSLVEWNRRMSRGLDEEVAPEYQDMLERMETGEMPAELTESEVSGGAEEGE